MCPLKVLLNKSITANLTRNIFVVTYQFYQAESASHDTGRSLSANKGKCVSKWSQPWSLDKMSLLLILNQINQIKFRTWRKPWSIFPPQGEASSASSLKAPKYVETDNSKYTLWRDSQLFSSMPPRFIVSEWRLACRFYLVCNYTEWTWPTDENIFSKHQRLHFLPPRGPQQPKANFSSLHTSG